MGKLTDSFKKALIVPVVLMATAGVVTFAVAAHMQAEKNKVTNAVKEDIEDQGYEIKKLDTTRRTEVMFFYGFYTFDFVDKSNKKYKVYYNTADFDHKENPTNEDYANFFKRSKPVIIDYETIDRLNRENTEKNLQIQAEYEARKNAYNNNTNEAEQAD